MPRITKRYVDSVSPPDKGYILRWDDSLKGFGLKVTARGTRTYIVFYRTGSGLQRRITIGRHGPLTPSEARERAKEIFGKVAIGDDPLKDRKIARGAPTFKRLADEYIARRASEKKIDEDKRILSKDVIPCWGNVRAKEIRRRDVIQLVDDIKDRGAPIMANRTLSVIKRVYNFGISRDLVESNPTTLVKAPSRENRRDRVLDEKEIRKFWKKLDKSEIGNLLKNALKLILVTAQRPGEVIGVEWSEIDLDTNWWTIPEDKSKNRLAHRVPLSPIAVNILSGIPNTNRFLFPARIGSSSSDTKPMTSHALSQTVRRNFATFDLEHFTPHDLRRTAASHMASMGISRLVIAKILNHAESSVTAVYDRHSYDLEKQNAIYAWNQKLANIIAGKKGEVISIASHRGSNI